MQIVLSPQFAPPRLPKLHGAKKIKIKGGVLDFRCLKINAGNVSLLAIYIAIATMATPFDAAAGVTSLISLGITAFQGCVQGFIILSTAHHLGKDADDLRSRIEWEHYRLFQWSQHAGVDGEGSVNSALDWAQILDILRQLEVQLNDTTELKTRYGLCLEDDDCQGHSKDSWQDTTEISFLRKSLRLSPKFFLASSRIIHERNKKHPMRRLRWAIIDKAKLEKLIGDVRQRISCLWDILAFEDRLYIRKSLSHLLRNGIASTRNDDELSCLSELALGVESRVSVAGQMKRTKIELYPRDHDPALSDTVKLSGSRTQTLRALKLRSSLLSSDAGSSGEEREVVSYAGEHALVEFKFLGPAKIIQKKLSVRAENLAILLSRVETASFHALLCKGFIKRNDYILLIFELPASTVPVAITTSSDRPYLTLSDVRKQQDYLPDLDTRVSWALKLAETVLQLHTAGWVHKNISPAHILFLKRQGQNESEPGHFAGPYLSGFGYAREISPSAFSEEQQDVDEEDAYRHALAQGSRRDLPFRPQFDVYALGIVLIELGLWSSIKDILQIEHSKIPNAFMDTGTMSTVRRKLEFSLPRSFVDAAVIALTNSTTREYINLEDYAEEEEDSDSEDSLEEDSIDIQQSVVDKIRSCL